MEIMAQHEEVVERAAGRSSVAEAMAAEGALREIATLRCPDWSRIPDDLTPRGSAMQAIAVAVPIALSLWMAIGMLVWALMR